MRPIVLLERVHARDAAGPHGGVRGSLNGVSLGLTAGVHAVLGTPEDGTLALFAAVTGARAPQRGRVTVSGRDPMRAASVRARMGVLGPEPRLPPAATVRDAVRLAMRARGETGDRFDAVIDPLGLAHLHGRDPRSLSFAEERAVELGLSLSTPAPVLLALHEPLAEVAVAAPALVAARLREVAATGACVIVTTSSPGDARTLADRVVVLHRGLVAREAVGGRGLSLAGTTELTAWVASGVRQMAAALARRDEVTGVAWDAGGEAGAGKVTVRGDDAEGCALALAAVAVEVGAEVLGIEERPVGLGEVRAATEVLWKMRRGMATPGPANTTGNGSGSGNVAPPGATETAPAAGTETPPAETRGEG